MFSAAKAADPNIVVQKSEEADKSAAPSSPLKTYPSKMSAERASKIQDINVEDTLKQLPEELRLDTKLLIVYPGNSCWSCTPVVIESTDLVPLTLGGEPVVIPVETQ